MHIHKDCIIFSIIFVHFSVFHLIVEPSWPKACCSVQFDLRLLSTGMMICKALTPGVGKPFIIYSW